MILHHFVTRTLLVKTLWFLAVLSLVFFVGITAYKMAEIHGLLTARMPELKLPKVAAIQSQLKNADNLAGETNPFDATGLHWSSQPRLVIKQAQGPAGGVMLLPDVSIALTAEGPVKTGETLAGGTLSQISARQLTIDTPDGQKTIDLPAQRRPGMARINKAPNSDSSKEKIQ